MTTRDEFILDIAKTMNGPWNEVPEGSPYTLEELRETKWGHLHWQDQEALKLVAGAVIDRMITKHGAKFP